MDFELFAEKIKQLNDDKLKELLQLKNKQNASIMQLAEKEALAGTLILVQLKEKRRGKQGTKRKKMKV